MFNLNKIKKNIFYLSFFLFTLSCSDYKEINTSHTFSNVEDEDPNKPPKEDLKDMSEEKAEDSNEKTREEIANIILRNLSLDNTPFPNMAIYQRVRAVCKILRMKPEDRLNLISKLESSIIPKLEGQDPLPKTINWYKTLLDLLKRFNSEELSPELSNSILDSLEKTFVEIEPFEIKKKNYTNIINKKESIINEPIINKTIEIPPFLEEFYNLVERLLSI